ncbi:hypothetical protein [Obesumbacterium proteus]|uniref:Uncharacterized protein n=1 Tax=Obesumbacterium proteus ATCC 12841 TaxID=1354268 RepID=A0AA91IMH2_9GAMM|nr:hypothetical protein [Obesumbacterium proteus]AMO82082.1 hypothetical protein DSM2777_14255 [Obesumbacterium proteus]OAT56767.1 hypothetical protein M993_04539 [Obesumbacterium proteus ATCC 12841]
MTSREQFEAAWEKNNECEPMDGWESLRCDDGYTDEIIDGQWWAWQASREAVEVEMPPQVDCCNVPFAAHSWNACLEESEKRIRAAGIKVKGE